MKQKTPVLGAPLQLYISQPCSPHLWACQKCSAPVSASCMPPEASNQMQNNQSEARIFGTSLCRPQTQTFLDDCVIRTGCRATKATEKRAADSATHRSIGPLGIPESACEPAVAAATKDVYVTYSSISRTLGVTTLPVFAACLPRLGSLRSLHPLRHLSQHGLGCSRTRCERPLHAVPRRARRQRQSLPYRPLCLH